MQWLMFLFCSICGYDRESFLDSTIGDVIYQIRCYKKFHSKDNKQQRHNNKDNGIKRGETETFSAISDEEYKRLQEEYYAEYGEG